MKARSNPSLHPTCYGGFARFRRQATRGVDMMGLFTGAPWNPSVPS
jgi:hypothetical protein